jgi:hypothetical protein
MGTREIIDSAIMIASATHSCSLARHPAWRLTTHPLAPSVLEETGPGAHPRCLDKGDRIPQPTNIPAVIDKVTGKPMMTPTDQPPGDLSTIVLTLSHVR